jgi:hypothetical protein
MIPLVCATEIDRAILHAELAFVRSEIAAKAAHPSAFVDVATENATTGGTHRTAHPTSRAQRLRELRDRLADACEDALRTHPHWPSVTPAAHLAIVMIAEETVHRGTWISLRAVHEHCRRAIESFYTIDSQPSEMTIVKLGRQLLASGLLYYAVQEGEVIGYAPSCLPPEVLQRGL